MKPLGFFEVFLKDGVVNKQRIDLARAKSLGEEAAKRKLFVEEANEKIGINDSNANYFIENVYDILIELIRAKMLIDGYKAAGLNAHEAEVSYLRLLKFPDSEILFMNELRGFRNGIKYYGKNLDAEYAIKVIEFLKNIYPKLNILIKQ